MIPPTIPRALALAAPLLMAVTSSAANFNEAFSDSTLRIDYILGGGPDGSRIFFQSQSKQPGWAGRRANLDSVPVAGNGTIYVSDPESGKILYANPFSSLFQEWINLPEAGETSMAFENSFIVPLPRHEADITLSLRDNHQQTIATLTHRYCPGDELTAIRGRKPLPHIYLHRGGNPSQAIDVAILAEGFPQEEMDSFLCRARILTDEILRYEPFASNKDKFNFVAVMSTSVESGTSIPLKGEWRDTALGSHFSTFHSARYLTAPRVRRMHELLEGIPYENILILVNSPEYGGGGIFNSYQIATAFHELTLPVFVHEFGHSFAGLADEYFYGEPDDTYPLDVEPWEQNITTLVDFNSKWIDIVSEATPVPTPWSDSGGTREERMKQKADSAALNCPIGAYEGGGYKNHGVFRPQISCRMRDNHNPSFCPVCRRAIQRIIDFYTKPGRD